MVQNSNQNSYQHGVTCMSYIYAMCWGSKRSSGRTSRKLIIKGGVLARGTHQDHIFLLIGKACNANTRCTMVKQYLLGLGVVVDAMARLVRLGDVAERRTTYCHLPIYTFRGHQMILGSVI